MIDGFAIDDPPCGLEAMVKAPVVINVWRKNFNRITDEMFFGFTAFSTVRIPTTLFVGILTTEFVAVETVIFLEDRLLRRLGINFGRQQGFQWLDSLFELLVLIFELLILFSELHILFGQLSKVSSLLSTSFRLLSKESRLLSNLRIPWISFWW